MLSKESNKFIVEMLEIELEKLKDMNRSFIVFNEKMAQITVPKINKINKALKELKDV